MHKCRCVKCGRTFITGLPVWFCEDCFEKLYQKKEKKK